MACFPTHLLYMCYDQCGLGFKRLSDEIQIRKLNMLQRGLYADEDTMIVCMSIVSRAARFNGIIPVKGQAYSFGKSMKHESWMSSLLERMDQCGLHFSCGGVNMDDSHSEQLMSFKHRKNLTEKDKKALTENDVHTFGDLTEVVNDQVKWVDLRRIKATFLSNLIAGKTPRQTALHLRQGICWLVLSQGDEIVYEHIGHIKRDEQ